MGNVNVMQASLINIFNLIPWELLLVSLGFTGLGIVSFLLWRSGSGRSRPWWSYPWAAWRGPGLFVFAFVLVVVCIKMTFTRYESVRELSQYVAPYPGAQIELTVILKREKQWIFTTKDDPGKVRTYYNDMARRQKLPFQALDDYKFTLGQGTDMVLVTTTDESGDGTTIVYQRDIANRQIP